MSACDRCLRRTWLLGELAGHLDRVRADIAEVLALGDEDLLRAVGGRRSEEIGGRWLALKPAALRTQADEAGLELICRCDDAFPPRVRDLSCPPAVLHVAGGMERFLAAAAAEPVAIVGSRAASAYGTSVAGSLARGLASAGVPVISGMAMGIDSAAHKGALQAGGPPPGAGGPTIAVLPGPADQPYPRGVSGLYRQVVRDGSAVSEMPPGAPVRSWMFLARNRIIAGIAVMTIVVEASARSGALLTASYASAAGRVVGAVPGRVTAPGACGPNQLLKAGAHVVRNAQDVLDLLFEAGSRVAPTHDRPALSPELQALLAAIEEGHDTAGTLIRRGILPNQELAGLASLELGGYISRGPGGRFTILP